MTRMMSQHAPFPHQLQALVDGFHYRPGWRCALLDEFVRERVDPTDDTSEPLSWGLTLDIITKGYNSYHPERGENYCVHHYMPVPPATYNYASWQRWLLEQHMLVERHEACEFFDVDGRRPFAPNHGPGWDPYIVTVVTTEEDRRTSFRGVVKDG